MKTLSRTACDNYKPKPSSFALCRYGEADRIITLYTLDFGKNKGIAKGAKRSQKRFGNTLEIGSYITVSFFEKETAELVRLSHCDLIRSLEGLRADIKKLAWASYLIELVNEMTGEKIPNRALFRLLLFSLHWIHRGSLREEILRVFESPSSPFSGTSRNSMPAGDAGKLSRERKSSSAPEMAASAAPPAQPRCPA